MINQFGVTPQGFRRKRLPDVKAELEAQVRAVQGDADLSPESVYGQIIGVLSKPLADAWEALENTYNSPYRSRANGAALDEAVFNLGITRREAASTSVLQSLVGEESTVVPAGSEVVKPIGDDVFASREPVTISASRMDAGLFSIPAVVDGERYSLQVNGSTFSATAGPGSTPETVAQSLAADIQNGIEPVSAVSTGGSFSVTIDDGFVFYGVSVSGGVLIDEISTPQLFYSVRRAAVDASAFQITKIQTPVLGWDRTVNRNDGQLGRERESDPLLRLRAEQSRRKIGGSSAAAIRSQILDGVPGVTVVTMGENRSDTIDLVGRPPHSFEAVVLGGESQAIADVIWQGKPAGIASHGNTLQRITDAAGNAQSVRFSRPVERFVWVDIEITRYAEEEYPVNGNQLVADAVLKAAQTFQVGQDVIRQRLSGRIHAVPGIAFANVRLILTDQPDTPPVNYLEDDIPIGPVEIAAFDRPRIAVRVLA